MRRIKFPSAEQCRLAQAAAAERERIGHATIVARCVEVWGRLEKTPWDHPDYQGLSREMARITPRLTPEAQAEVFRIREAARTA